MWWRWRRNHWRSKRVLSQLERSAIRESLNLWQVGKDFLGKRVELLLKDADQSLEFIKTLVNFMDLQLSHLREPSRVRINISYEFRN